MGKILGIAIQNYGSLKNIKMGKLFSDRTGNELGNMVAIIGASGNGKVLLLMHLVLFRIVFLRMLKVLVILIIEADMIS